MLLSLSLLCVCVRYRLRYDVTAIAHCPLGVLQSNCVVFFLFVRSSVLLLLWFMASVVFKLLETNGCLLLGKALSDDVSLCNATVRLGDRPLADVLV